MYIILLIDLYCNKVNSAKTDFANPAPIIKCDKKPPILLGGFHCRKRDLNPHERNVHTDLNRARLPIPPFLLSAGDGT